MSDLIQPIEVDRVKLQLEARNFKRLRQLFNELDSADIGEILTEVDIGEAIALYRLVPRERRSEVFSYLPFERQEQMLEELPEAVVSTVINDMEPDDRTRLLEALPFEIRNKLLLKLSPEERRIAWQLLSYPEDSIGRLMTPEFVALRASSRVHDVLEMMRWGKKYPEEILRYLFVTDAEGKYIGDVSLASLVLADPQTQPIAEVMVPPQVALSVNADDSTAVDYFRKYDRSYFPVVDDNQVLLGIVTADDVFDVAEEEATEDIHQFGGTSVLEDSYFQTPMFTLFRKRAGWLAALFAVGTLTASALRHYEEMAASMTWLIFFLPLIVSAGGNTGSQAASLMIRGIALKEMNHHDWIKVLGRELLVGTGLGVVLGTFGFLRAVTWDLAPMVAVIVGASLLGVVLFGAITGAMLPFLFKRFNLDPAVSSSPLLASLVDIFGVLIFYNVADFGMGLWQTYVSG